VDKKSLIGLGLIGVILALWLWMSGPSKEQIARNKVIRDSIELAQRNVEALEAERLAAAQPAGDTLKEKAQVSDSAQAAEVQDKYKDFAVAHEGEEKEYVIENDLLKAYVSSKGGLIRKVELKKYKRHGEEGNLVLFEGDSTRFALALNLYDRSRIFYTDEFFFKPVKQTAESIVMRLQTAKAGSYIDFEYSLKPGDYMVSSSISFAGMQGIVSQTEDQLQLSWSMLYPSQEKHIVKEKEAATVYYKQTVNDPDYLNPKEDKQKDINESDIKWVSLKQQFFNASIIANESFGKAGSSVRLAQRPGSPNIVKAAGVELGIPFKHNPLEKFSYSFYFGPNHFPTLKAYGLGLENIIPTGWSIFSYINKWLVIPLFNWLDFLNMGIVILLLTVVVKVLLLPIAYKTYMSGARMRVLKPETDALNAKYGKNADPMKKQQEQMLLYRKAGVNPLSGCIPLLLQFPILIALFNFVPAAIELRQASFLWADDLSTYDSILNFGYVPFINWAYGDHVSLFAALMFVSTILYTWMNSSMMPQQNNAQMPGMKFMMYFMPVIFLAVMNSYAAGLSWYYFLANMLTFVQNWIIRRIVSDKKIRAQIELNMKKPMKVSGFQKRLEEMAKQRQQQPVRRK
jgi:YidC/Oxa1 family membrane protein insertase